MHRLTVVNLFVTVISRKETPLAVSPVIELDARRKGVPAVTRQRLIPILTPAPLVGGGAIESPGGGSYILHISARADVYVGHR